MTYDHELATADTLRSHNKIHSLINFDYLHYVCVNYKDTCLFFWENRISFRFTFFFFTNQLF